MSFEIYFDESHKLDRQTSDYSYYGAIGWDNTTRVKFENYIENLNIRGELHFRDFRLDKIENYLRATEFALSKIHGNFFIVDTNEAFKICDRININKTQLRSLLYIKIPERLIYGITRRIEKFNKVDIFIDKSEEYGENKLSLETKLKDQLNAQAVYRGLQYSVDKVKQLDSLNSKSIQITDVIIGIIVFLFEEKYLNPPQNMDVNRMNNFLNENLLLQEEVDLLKASYIYKKYDKSGKEEYKLIVNNDDKDAINKLKKIIKKCKIYSKESIQKSEFIYRLLMHEENIDKLEKLNLFLWTDDTEELEGYVSSDILRNCSFKEVKKENISKYIAHFIQFKTEYDNYNRLKLLEFHYSNQELKTEKDYNQYLGFGSGLKKLTRRYLSELNIQTSN